MTSHDKLRSPAPPRLRAHRIAAAAFAALLAGCAAGPNFKPPAAPGAGRHTATALPARAKVTATALGRAQQLVPDVEVGTQWWHALGSARLDEPRAQAFAAVDHRYTLGVANYTRLMAAQQQVQQTHIELIAAQSQRLIDSLALYQVMAGGHANANENVSRE